MNNLVGKFVPESRSPDLKRSLLFSVYVYVNHVVCCEDTAVVECWCFCGRAFCLEGSGADQSPGKYLHKLLVAVCRGVFFFFFPLVYLTPLVFFFLSRKQCMCWVSVVFKDQQPVPNKRAPASFPLCEVSKWDVKSEHGVLFRTCCVLFFSHRDQSRRVVSHVHVCHLFYERDCVNCTYTRFMHHGVFTICHLSEGCGGFCVMWSTLLSLC